MHLTLLVPGLIWPRGILHDTVFDLPLPSLSLLLGRGDGTAPTTVDAWLARAFGTRLPLPVAALRLLGEGGQPRSDRWLCLDPVHLRVDERTVVLDEPSSLMLSAEEDQALRAAVAPLFADLGELAGGRPGHWHLRLAHRPYLETVALAQAIGRAIDPAVPAGRDGARWRNLLAEAQMLLHAHPVSHRRHAENLPAPNSLWPWGAGRLREATGAAFDQVWSDDGVVRGLGMLNRLPVLDLPGHMRLGPGRVLAHYHRLAAPAAVYDALGWREAASGLEQHWLAPALQALRGGQLHQLSLIAAGEGRASAVELGRGGLLRFWRRPCPLAEWVP